MIDQLPVVAIVGRPNVGKSSLFNMLVGEPKSIVDEMEGVTRDINIALVKTLRSVFYLYDTAGYLEKGDVFNELVQKKVKEAIRDADLILFVVDGRAYHAFDEELALLLKKEAKKTIIVANKLDNRDMEGYANEFYNLGLEEIIPYSVTHKRGYSTLVERIEDIFEGMATQDIYADDEIKIALVGKPNVGKSQLINTMLGYERSIVSDIPGTTRDSVDDTFMWNKRRIRLIDTAGLRRKNKIDEDVEYYSNVRTVKAIENSEVVLQLLDSTENLSQQDKRITDMVIEKGRGLILVPNKWDLNKIPSDENYRLMEDYKKAIYKELPAYRFVPIEIISALDKYRLPKLMETVERVHHDYRYRVPTAKLNEWLKNEIRESNEDRPVSDLKVYYATQIYTSPPGFMFFINKMSYVRKDYPRFLENRIRLAFEFTGVPIKVIFREKERDNKEKSKKRR